MNTTRHNDRHRKGLQGTLTLWVLVLTGLATLVALPAQAQRKVEFLNEGRGVKSLPTISRDASSNGAPLVRVEGRVDRNRSTGLRMGKLTLQMSRTTAIYPEPRGGDASIDPRVLAGRDVTVYGRRFGSTIQAQLVIVQSRPSDLSALLNGQKPLDREFVIPADTGARVGEYKAGAPE